MGRDDLLGRQAAGLAWTANARAQNEDDLPGCNRRHQIGDEFRRIAAVAVEKDQNVGVIAHGGNARLNGATVAASWLDHHASPGGLRPLDGAVPRAAVDNDNFAHILRQHRGYDPANRRFLIEARNDH